MMKTWRSLATVATLAGAVLAYPGSAQAQQSCAPGISQAFQEFQAQYTALRLKLLPERDNLEARLHDVVDQPTYQLLLDDARTLANSLPTGRLLVTLPDGTTVVDTAKTDDPTCDITDVDCGAWGGYPEDVPVGCPCANGQRNSYGHFQKKSVNENHNSRIAILAAQQWPCGLGLETKFSTSSGTNEHYVAARLGDQYDNEGTARLSIKE
jgi:hypothetical protein